MARLRSLVFNALWLVFTVVMTTATALALPFPARCAQSVAAAWSRGTGWLLRLVCGIRVEVRGREHLPTDACIVACKHQSAWETVVFLHLLPWAVYTPKIELIRLPIFGRCLRKIGHIGIDRKAGARALRDLVEGSRAALALGRQVVVFPEGRRVAVGHDSKYHAGIAALYSQCDARVVPVALNSGCSWARNAFVKHPGTIVIEFLEAIEPGRDKREFLELLRERIESRTDLLVAEARAAPGQPASTQSSPRRSS